MGLPGNHLSVTFVSSLDSVWKRVIQNAFVLPVGGRRLLKLFNAGCRQPGGKVPQQLQVDEPGPARQARWDLIARVSLYLALLR